MGCGGSKIDDFQLVTLCKERKEFIKAASQQRYALAAAHIKYFQSLKDIGDALRNFVEEELVISGADSSSPGSPVLTLPSDEGKRKKPKSGDKNKNSSSSTSISHSVPISLDNSSHEHDIEDSHLHLSSGSESGSELASPSGHIHIVDSPQEQVTRTPPYAYSPTEWNPPPYAYPPGDWSPPPYAYPPRDWNPSPYSYPPPRTWSPSGTNMYSYYMKKSATPAKTVVFDSQERYSTANWEWAESSNGYPGYSQYGNGGFFGFPMGTPQNDFQYRQPSPPAPPPAPPSPPKVSAWDYINVFDNYDYGHPGYYSQSRFGYGSTASSPDSSEVRRREGIPDLEDETEHEMLKKVHKEKKKMSENSAKNDSGEGTSKAIPSQSSDDSLKTARLHGSGSSMSAEEKVVDVSPDTIVATNSLEETVRKKAVSFEVDGASKMDIESPKLRSLTALSTRGTRDLKEVVREIQNEFETASSYGKEVAMLLEVRKLPYQPKSTALKVIFSRVLYLLSPSTSHSRAPYAPPVRLDSRTKKLAKAYGSGGSGNDINMKSGNISSTLEKLYVWEKKLYKEVKDEERLRVIYEKECKRLKHLDERGADSSKISATQASIRKLLTKIDVCIRAVDAISSQIHKLRDEELQPQITELIHGLIRMWRSMFKCHQKQFQAIVESKMRSLKAKTGMRNDSSLKATLELEVELANWCSRFNNWITTQKSYVECLNGWLLRCLDQEQEETADGVAPFSPGRMGAPPIFIICNDWHQAMFHVSGDGVENSMNEFASNLHHLWERQDEEQRRRIRAELLSRDLETRLKTLRMERQRMEHDHDGMSEKTTVSKVPSESGVSPLDDLKVDLDSMRKKLDEERSRHKDALKLVHHAASSSIQAGLIPIFEALGAFSSEVLKAHEQVRLR